MEAYATGRLGAYRYAILVCVALLVLGGVIVFTREWNSEALLAEDIQAADSATLRALKDATASQAPWPIDLVEESVGMGDVDADGDMDAVGFVSLGADGGKTKILATWHKGPEGYTLYEDGYNDFRFGGTTSCSLLSIAVDTLKIGCTDSGYSNTITLHYEEAGGGYYRDISQEAIVHTGTRTWKDYSSAYAGISFSYPPDIVVTEKTYDFYGRLITAIVGAREGKEVFEILSEAAEPSNGGSVIENSDKVRFLSLTDGTYLSRRIYSSDVDAALGTYYHEVEAPRLNNVGSHVLANNSINVRNGRSYMFYTPAMTMGELTEVDQIFVSARFRASSGTAVETVSTPYTPVSIGNKAFATVAGRATIEDTRVDPPVLQVGVIFIDTAMHRPATLVFELLPFGTVGGTGSIGGGGYDAEKDSCFRYEREVYNAPELLGANRVCQFGYGDAGYSSVGYFVLDPAGKHILKITQASDEVMYAVRNPNIEDVARSVRFTTEPGR